MKLHHFETLQPQCPACLVERGTEVPIQLGVTARREGDDILDGTLHCPECTTEYPILDGIPVLLPRLRDYVQNNLLDLIARADLSPEVTGVIGDLLGQDHQFDRSRQFLSTYGWGHYGELDPDEPRRDEAGSVVRVLRAGLELCGDLSPGPILDAGCSVGRTTFELAAEAGDDLVLGVDVNLAMLRMAARVLRQGEVRYPRRRVGVVYDERRFEAAFEGADRVDFWACDAQALPFPRGTFGGALSLNVLDCVSSPGAHLQALGRVLREEAPVIVSSPYEWSAQATPLDAWLGGRSQRNRTQGRSELVMRAMVHPGGSWSERVGLAFEAELPDVRWDVRLHDRGTLRYSSHVVVARSTGTARIEPGTYDPQS